MTDTLGTLKDAIAEELHEPSDSPVIARMIQSALKFYKGKRFLFSEASDIVPVSKGSLELTSSKAPHIQRPISMSDIGVQSSTGSLEGLLHFADGRTVESPSVDPSGTEGMVFDYEPTEHQGTRVVTDRIRWDPDGLSLGSVIPRWTNPETGATWDGPSLSKTPLDPDGYVMSEVNHPVDIMQEVSPSAHLWHFGFYLSGPSGFETIDIDHVERHITYNSQLPPLLGGIDAIHVDSSSGIWHTMTRVTMPTLRAHQTSRVLRGVPNVWSWHAQTLYLYPAASRDLLLRIDYLKDATRDESTGYPMDPATSPDSFTNPFFYEGGELLLTRACALYALRRVHDQEMANRFKLANQEIETALKAEMNRPKFLRNKVRGYWSENRGGRY
jgi:hypothetical protein